MPRPMKGAYGTTPSYDNSKEIILFNFTHTLPKYTIIVTWMEVAVASQSSKHLITLSPMTLATRWSFGRHALDTIQMSAPKTRGTSLKTFSTKSEYIVDSVLNVSC